MMGELMKMIVMIKKCTNSSQSCKLIESQRKNFNFNVFFFLMGHTHNLLRWTLDLLYIFSLLLIKYYDNEMFTVSNNIDGKVCPPCCFCSADAKLFQTASTVMITSIILRNLSCLFQSNFVLPKNNHLFTSSQLCSVFLFSLPSIGPNFTNQIRFFYFLQNDLLSFFSGAV